MLIHNTTDNAAQVTNTLNLLIDNGDGSYKLNTYDNYVVKIDHVVPFGVIISNMNSLNGTDTLYVGMQSDNKYFNRGYLRGGDVGGRVSIIVRNSSLLTVNEIITNLALITGTCRMVTTTAAYYMHAACVAEVGLISEGMTLAQALINYQTILSNRGYTYG